MVSSFTTLLQADELIQSIHVPKLSSGVRWGFYKFSQKAGEFAHVIGGVVFDPERDFFRAVIGGYAAAFFRSNAKAGLSCHPRALPRLEF
jgi:carbon-monoxide dehydrogenase medium subunit